MISSFQEDIFDGNYGLSRWRDENSQKKKAMIQAPILHIHALPSSINKHRPFSLIPFPSPGKVIFRKNKYRGFLYNFYLHSYDLMFQLLEEKNI